MRAKEGRGGIMGRRREEAFGGLCSGSFFDVRGYRPIDRPTDRPTDRHIDCSLCSCGVWQITYDVATERGTGVGAGADGGE